MADLPKATIVIDDEAGSFGAGGQYLAIFAPVRLNADMLPRVFSSTKGLLAQHDYNPGVDFAALYFQEAKLPVVFLGLPIATVGAVYSPDNSGVVGTSVITAAAAANGILDEAEVVVTVDVAGTISTDGIALLVSQDGGRTNTSVRLGTATSYTIPYLGLTLSFAAGTLIKGDVFRCWTRGPMWDATGLATARANLATGMIAVRSWLLVGDLPNSTLATGVTTQANAFETANDRFVYARTSVADRLPLVRKSRVPVESLTFASGPKTITRTAGSFLTEGFAIGHTFTTTGTVSNNGTFSVTAVTATVLTVAETIAAETINSILVTMIRTQTKAAWVASTASAFGVIDAQRRIDLAIGRARKASAIHGSFMRRPPSWAFTIREYQKDLQIPAWRKADGPLDGWSLEDTSGIVSEEFDERTDGGGLANRFSCFRTWANGPRGTFGALSMTRAAETSLLSRTHNMAVINEACRVCHAETENSIGQVLVLDSAGRATAQSRQLIEGRVNSALDLAILRNGPEGPRASFARWSMAPDDVLNVTGATANGVLLVRLNGTLEKISTRVRVQTNG
jgi:hypothetical protein